MPTNILETYAPQPELVELKGTDPEGWWIELSANATVVELAVLMHGLDCQVRADHTGEGVFCVRPIDPQAPRPTTQRIHDILTRGFGDRLPMLLCRQAG